MRGLRSFASSLEDCVEYFLREPMDRSTNEKNSHEKTWGKSHVNLSKSFAISDFRINGHLWFDLKASASVMSRSAR
jgi:hypothetical protein